MRHGALVDRCRLRQVRLPSRHLPRSLRQSNTGPIARQIEHPNIMSAKLLSRLGGGQRWCEMRYSGKLIEEKQQSVDVVARLRLSKVFAPTGFPPLYELARSLANLGGPPRSAGLPYCAWTIGGRD
jgi:hypothetical protein